MLFYRINIRRGHTPTHVKKKIKLTLKQIVGLISIISDMWNRENNVINRYMYIFKNLALTECFCMKHYFIQYLVLDNFLQPDME